jgi:ubiquinone/menaquinone biosynthesis C-methylase UbiE
MPTPGRVYGVDASEDMLALARRNAELAGAANVEFRRGHIEICRSLIVMSMS